MRRSYMLAPMPPRRALLAPFGPPASRGNAVTVARVALGLTERGIEVRLWDLSAIDTATVESEIEAYRPALVHAFHAYRVGPLALRLAHRVEIPLVVTLTGTDANHDLLDPVLAPVVKNVLASAHRITVFHESVGNRVTAGAARCRPAIGRRPPVRAPAGKRPVQSARALAASAADRALRVSRRSPSGEESRLSAGAARRLARAIPEICLLYAGPVLEPSVGEALERALSTKPWASHVGEVAHERMASLLSQADVVLNCSSSEGGMAKSVLEALPSGARSWPPTSTATARSWPTAPPDSFRDEAEFERRAAQLARDPTLRDRLGRAGTALVTDAFPRHERSTAISRSTASC